MAKQIKKYICSSCGYGSLSELGKCPKCGEWGSFVEDTPIVQDKKTGAIARAAKAVPLSVLDAKEEPRVSSGIDELDRVLGGGFVPGGVILLGGEPGVGKSTLLLQVASNMAKNCGKVLYISGEESAGQVALRGKRLGLLTENLELLCVSNLPSALATAQDGDYKFMVVDSVQAFRADDESGWAGSPTQVKGVASMVTDVAKSCNIPTVLVGHITKQGSIAGPKLLEHLVDAVLLFSGEEASPNRLLRAEKNRFGSTDELGIFEMSDKGLNPVSDPSHLYWNGNDATANGVAIALTMEGSRALAAEIQALATFSPFPYPKRTARGVELSRLQLLLAVLEKRSGLSTRQSDTYLNVTGGLTLRDPSADLAICAAVASSVTEVPIPSDVCFIGEVGLAGEVRPAIRTLARIKEAARLGFKTAVISRRTPKENYPIEVLRISRVGEIRDLFLK